jgi:hypothetical protein
MQVTRFCYSECQEITGIIRSTAQLNDSRPEDTISSAGQAVPGLHESPLSKKLTGIAKVNSACHPSTQSQYIKNHALVTVKNQERRLLEGQIRLYTRIISVVSVADNFKMNTH